jgi:hypothetical protein
MACHDQDDPHMIEERRQVNQPRTSERPYRRQKRRLGCAKTIRPTSKT